MTSPLASYRQLIATPLDAVSWACALEATAPKLGNVHPSAAFDDLRWRHFAAAADALREGLAGHERLGVAVRAAVVRSLRMCPSNANLGIALLLTPLQLATERCLAVGQRLPVERREQRAVVAEILDGLDEEDAAEVFAAIRLANPGGLGSSPAMDVRDRNATPGNLREAMRLARDWDQIARAYDDGFTTIYEGVVPRLEQSLVMQGDLLLAIRQTQLALLAERPDTLIRRKCGRAVAAEVQRRAGEVLRSDPPHRMERQTAFDAFLRADGNRRNPGTTADLIAAGLHVLLSSVGETEILDS